MTPSTVIFLLSIATALSVTTVFMIFRDVVVRRRQAIDARLLDRKGLTQVSSDAAKDSRGVATSEPRADDWLERLVAQSGVDLTGMTVLLLALALGVLVGASALLWTDNFYLLPAGAALCMLGCYGFLISRRSRQRRLIREQLPDAISLLARTAHAGESIEQGVKLIADHIGPPLDRQFRQCSIHLDMGLSVEPTMRALGRRVPTREMQILVSTLIVQRSAGGNLAETLEKLVRIIRDRLNYHRHFRAATAAPRLATYLLAFVGPLGVVALWRWRPQWLEMFVTSTYGTMMLAIAITLYVAGVATLFQFMREKY